jgi:hypothetical protein
MRRLDVTWSAAIGMAMVDTVRGADFQTRHLLLALKVGEPYRLARALAVEAGFASIKGPRGRPRQKRILSLARELVVGLDVPDVVGWINGVEGLGLYQSGELEAALEACSRSNEILTVHGSTLFFEWTSIQLYTLWALYYLGEIAEVCERVPRLLRESRERGDLYAVTNLSTGLSTMAWLARDQIEHARRENDEAIARWSKRGFHLQHYWWLLARLMADFYSGETAESWDTLQEYWGELESSYYKYVYLVRAESSSLRGRAALVSVQRDPKRMLAEAERSAAVIEKIQVEPWRHWAQLLRAGVSAQRGDVGAAIEQLRSAEEQAAGVNMALHAICARRQRGVLIGGDEGARLIESADKWMREQRIARPDRVARMIAPGFDTDAE